MKGMRFLAIGLVIASVSAFVGIRGAMAQGTPTFLNYQGKLTSPGGVPVADGFHDVTFRIFDLPNGGTLLWEELRKVETVNGVFSVPLGEKAALKPDVFKQRLFLEIEIGGNKLLPRQELGSVAFSVRALTMPDGSITTAMIGEAVVTSAKIASGAVRADKIAANAVQTGKIVDKAVTGAKLADNSVSETKIADNAVATRSVGDGQITGAKIAANSVGPALLTSDYLSLAKVSGGRMVGLESGKSMITTNLFVNANGWEDPNAYVDLAIGDNDTGFKWRGDGWIDFFTQGTTLAHFSQFGINLKQGRLYLDNHGWGGQPAYDLTIGDSDTGLHWPADGHIDFYSNGVRRARIDPEGLDVDGNLSVTGTISKGGGSFKIDHPLDPDNKYLYHSFVESPDMKNIYDGVVKLDRDGTATVKLPDYFEALNRDYRYQLTCIGGYAQVYVKQKVKNNRFVIAGGKSDIEVSWMITGIRQDDYAKENRIIPEVSKQPAEKGNRLYTPESSR